MARAADKARGDRAFASIASSEMFEESIKMAMATWRLAGSNSACLNEADAGRDRPMAIYGEFKARVALEALRGDKTVQEVAAKHKVQPNQVSTWKRQAIDGQSEVFSNGADRDREDYESGVRNLHAKIGQLTVELDFLANGLKG